MTDRFLSWLGPITLGAGAMYLLDPDRGARRRALVRDAAVHTARLTRDGADALSRDLGNRVAGVGAELRGRFDNSPADDVVIEARVRSELGRVSSHPGAIDVTSSFGRVTLSGPILASEHGSVVRAIGRIRGVDEVVDNLERHEAPDSVPALQGGVARPGQLWLPRWSPTAQFLTAVAGIGLVAYGASLRRSA